MRYFVQFVVPVLILIVLAYLVASRRKNAANGATSPIISNNTFITLLVIGAGFTLALLFGLAQF